MADVKVITITVKKDDRSRNDVIIVLSVGVFAVLGIGVIVAGKK